MRVGLYLNNLDEEYQITIFKALRKECQKKGMNLICIQGETVNANSAMRNSPFPSRKFLDVDGIILMSSVVFDHEQILKDNSISRLFSNIPTISLGSMKPEIPSIIIRSSESMGEIMRHLIEDHGYRKFLYLGGPVHHTDNTIRENVFKEHIEDARSRGIEISGVIVNGGFHEGSGTTLVSEYIERHYDDPVDVIVSANDNMAIGAMKALYTQMDEKWRSCAITGFDDIPQAKHEKPALTTVHQPLDTLCSIAVDLMFDLLTGKRVSPVTYIDSEVCIRNSCGCSGYSIKGPGEGTESDSTSLKKALSRIEYQSLRHEQNNRSVSYLGQRLITSYSVDVVVYHVKEFVRNIGVRSFYFCMYEQPLREVPEQAYFIYRKKDDVERSFSERGNPVSLKYLFSEIMKEWDGAGLSVYHLTSGDEVLGIIVYEAEDFAQPHICSAAVFLANTIKRLKMMEEEKERARHLEDLVAIRTRDLVEANQKLQEESQKRMLVEAEVLRIGEMERLRFSLDLHDDICQRLAAISMFSKNIMDKEGIRELSAMIDETLQRTRRYAHNSYPVELGSLGLNEALDNLCRTVDKQVSGQCRYTWNIGDGSPFSGREEINLYRIVQEAVQNAVKHSEAGVISVSVEEAGEYYRVTVTDNGTGNCSLADSEKILSGKGKRPRGLGLRSMEYRARQIGAEYWIDSSPEKGTTVGVRIPKKGMPLMISVE